MNYHFNAESFGSDCPENWESICEVLNAILDEYIETTGQDNARVIDAYKNDLWDWYWKNWDWYYQKAFEKGDAPVLRF